MDNRLVVSNTTPLIALAWLEKLALLLDCSFSF